MNTDNKKTDADGSWISRRNLLKIGIASGSLAFSGYFFLRQLRKYKADKKQAEKPLAVTPVLIAKAKSYGKDIASIIRNGFTELGIQPKHVKGKRILLKPNYIETLAASEHINTHSNVIAGTIEAFYSLGASSIVVAEGSGNCRDTYLILEDTGLVDVIKTYKMPFVDLNYSDCFTARNLGQFTNLRAFALPEELRKIDIVVSMAKMKTHHWAGITASMKNLFGLMPGSFYGWPKNVLHYHGIEKSILDINATIKPHFAIVDGIVGMEGDGPIMGVPKNSGVLVMGYNLASVDATCARIMGIDPSKIGYLAAASTTIGPIDERQILQRGEQVREVQTKFALCDHIPVMKKLIKS